MFSLQKTQFLAIIHQMTPTILNHCVNLSKMKSLKQNLKGKFKKLKILYLKQTDLVLRN